MDYFPLFCDLKGKRCLIVGGGQVATHKARGLLLAGATLRLVAPSITSELELLCAEHDIEWLPVPLIKQHLTGCWLAIAATNDAAANRLVSQWATAEQKFCNCVDDPSCASFITPAIIDCSPVIIAVSCGGHAPVYSKILKQHLSEQLPAGMREMVLLAGVLRERVNQSCDSRERKRAFWTMFFHHAPLRQAVSENNTDEIHQQVESLFQNALF
ncbi:bifunctional precorrin-2 dehydrogenase/sirohydrochlorin ferrochelatase [Buttiauxella selenatireducens]|uniref:precorrin-2 dehydrogenase n=1 Tax=Buttiauxella selenatireducens TaxID=3073902 RepID=A0ABY9SEK6_9ENTR|nr:bifunctional precorrin-2 dehydrogenase/sirohydrochlorin ferrochelatase [Buttiauxella sp. R73]WMY75300.1 bifunctional precorrin-2 dehydrogenase/sirohydrochlorin ferrochelatase [Buttiauxella sp. R73]